MAVTARQAASCEMRNFTPGIDQKNSEKFSTRPQTVSAGLTKEAARHGISGPVGKANAQMFAFSEIFDQWRGVNFAFMAMNQPAAPSPVERPPGAELLFYEALEKSPEVRGAWLDYVCGGDAALRQEVETLLEDHERARGFLSEEAAAERHAGAGGVESVAERPGTYIGPYKLLEQIGEGGFGTVWVAEQEQPVRRRVALKVIKLGMDTKEVLARFSQERQALALMDHPNIARMFDAGATPLGRPYFVMELVRGVKITEYCDRARLTTGERLRLFMQVCHAVQHAHQKGVIHRDLKPSNILITLHDGVPVPKVIDFGVAKATREQRLSDLTAYTQFQQMIGTPAYMAPEQAEMSGLDVDTRSDIYSLGVLLYELLTGKTPFDHERLLRAGCDEMRRVLREEEPPKPSTFVSTMALDLRTDIARRRSEESGRLVSLIRGDLDWIAMKALEKDRARRYDTASSLAEDIGRHLTSEPVQARPASVAYRLRKMVRRNKLAVAAAAAVLAALVTGLGVSSWMFLREKNARDKEKQALERAVAAEKAQREERTKAENEAVKSTQVAEFLQDMLKGVEPSVAMGRDTTLLREILHRTADRIGRDLKDRPEVETELRHTLAGVYQELGDSKKAIDLYRGALATARKLWGDEHEHVASTLSNLSLALGADGQLTEAESTQRESLAIYRKLRGSEHEDVADVLDSLGGMVRLQGRLPEAESLHREALAMRRKLLGSEHTDTAASLNNLASVLEKRGNLSEAEVLYREALEVLRKQLEPGDPRVATTLNNLAGALKDQNKLAEAGSLHREALAMLRKLHGHEHRHVATSLNNLAAVLEKQGELRGAESLYREALAMRRKLLGDEHPEVATSLNNLAVFLEQRRQLPEAEAMHREALAMNRKLLGDDHPNVAFSLNNLASALAEQGKLAEAETLYRQSLAMSRKLLGDEHPKVGNTFVKLAKALNEQNKRDEFESLVREELAIVRKLTVKDPPRLEAILKDLGVHLYEGKKYAEAEPLLLECYEMRQQKKAPNSKSIRSSVTRLIRHYEAWEKPDKAAEWQRKLDDFRQR